MSKAEMEKAPDEEARLSERKDDNSLIRQIWIGFVCNLLIVDSGFHEGWSTPMIPKLEHDDPDVRITPGQGAWIINLLYVGVGVGSLIPLLLMDRIGRKWTMLVAALPKIASWLLFAVARDPYSFYAGRLLAGVGSGVTYCVTPMYVGEVSTKRTRGPMSASLAVWINIGMLLVYGLGLSSSRLTVSLVAATIPILFLVCFAWLPKSAVFLAKTNRLGQAARALRWQLAREDVDEELEEIKRVLGRERTAASGDSLVRRLRRPESLRAFVVTAILMSAMIFSGAAPILAYQAYTFEEAGFALSTDVSVLASGLAIVVAGLGCVVLVSRTGKRPLLLTAAPTAAVSLGLVASFFALKSSRSVDVSGFEWLPSVCLVTYALAYGLALNPLPLSYISEVFPPDAKVPATLFTSLFYAVGSLLVVEMYQLLRDSYGTHAPFWCFSAVTSVIWLLIYLIVPETEGKSLEEIQVELRGCSKEKTTNTSTREKCSRGFESSRGRFFCDL